MESISASSFYQWLLDIFVKIRYILHTSLIVFVHQQERVGNLKGGIEFLEHCGFQREGGFLYLPRDKVDPGVLVTAGSLLESALTNPFFGVL